MEFKEFKKNVAMMFPPERGEADDQYQFFLKEAVEPFQYKANLEKAWEKIKDYEGNTKRPRFSFFRGIASGAVQSGPIGSVYYKCKCGALLSGSSAGGCPVCKSPGAEWRISSVPVNVIPARSSCFDCSIYSEMAIGPTCPDYGSPKFEDCKDRGRCKCAACCRFEYRRTYHPKSMRETLGQAIKALPPPISEAGKAFFDGRASIKEINSVLKWQEKKREESRKEA